MIELRECVKHGLVNHYKRQDVNGFRCLECNRQNMLKARIRLKTDLIEFLGGKCMVCGYNKSIWALDFHHRNREEKLYHISKLITSKRRALAFEEVKKCDLLCANCHREKEHEIFGRASR